MDNKRSFINSSSTRDNSLADADYYPTPPWATWSLLEILMKLETKESSLWKETCWEPACGGGHMVNVLKQQFSDVVSSDINRYEGAPDDMEIQDFLFELAGQPRKVIGSIITNPPFKHAAEFIVRALELVKDDGLVCMFTRITILEGVSRYKKVFNAHKPERICVFSERVSGIVKGGLDNSVSSQVCYCWLIFRKTKEPPKDMILQLIPPGTKKQFGPEFDWLCALSG